MASMNFVIVAGNLTRAPELRQTAGGSAVCELRVAVNDAYTSRAGEKIESVLYADIVVWDRQAETCAEYLEKGASVLVEGRLKWEEWQNEDGQKRSRIYVRAHRVEFLGKARARVEPEDASKCAAAAFDL